MQDLVVNAIHREGLAGSRHAFPHFVVGAVFIGQTAEEAVAYPGNLGGVEGQALLLGHFDRDRREVLDEGRAA